VASGAIISPVRDALISPPATQNTDQEEKKHGDQRIRWVILPITPWPTVFGYDPHGVRQ
jgi:hypothetical protein